MISGLARRNYGRLNGHTSSSVVLSSVRCVLSTDDEAFTTYLPHFFLSRVVSRAFLNSKSFSARSCHSWLMFPDFVFHLCGNIMPLLIVSYFLFIIHDQTIHSSFFYSAPSSPLILRGTPNTARILCRSFTTKRHRQL